MSAHSIWGGISAFDVPVSGGLTETGYGHEAHAVR